MKLQWMKKCGSIVAAMALVFALILFADDLAVVSRAATAAKVTAKSANIRKEPNSTSTAVGSAVKDTKIEIISQTKGTDGKTWYEVRVDANTNGYVRFDLVEITDGSTPPEKGASSDTPAENQKPTVDNSGVEALNPVGAAVSGSNSVRVRTSASAENANNILTKVDSGTKVTVIGRCNDKKDGKVWYQVKFSASGKDVIGFIRYDYLTLSGDATPLTQEVEQPGDVQEPEEPEVTPEATPAPEVNKRYETKLINEKWYILDYEVGQQYEIDKLFVAADEYKALFEAEQGKNTAGKIWIGVLAVIAVIFLGCAIYLVYRLKECKEEAFIASIENNTLNNRGRTAERPKRTDREVMQTVGGGKKPVIKEGIEDEEEKPQRPAPQGGQRPAQNGQRPAPQVGQRPAPQGGQRPAPQVGQRPAPQGGQKPAAPQKPQRPAANQPAPKASGADNGRKARNFAQDDDDFEFEFLNWDNDEE